MKDDPADILAIWQLLLMVVWVLVVLPVAAGVGVATRWGGIQPPRRACRTCGFAMVALERECPRCRAR